MTQAYNCRAASRASLFCPELGPLLPSSSMEFPPHLASLFKMCFMLDSHQALKCTNMCVFFISKISDLHPMLYVSNS